MPPFAYRIPKLIALLGLMLLAAFTWIDKGPSRALLWPWYLYAQLLLLLPSLWLIAHGLLYGRVLRFGQGLDWALLGFATAMIAAAIASPYPGASTAFLPIVLAPITVAYVVRNWIGTHSGPCDQGPALVACGGAIALGLTTFWMLLVWFLRNVLPAHSAGAPWIAALGIRNEQLLGHPVYIAGIGLLTTTWLAGLAAERKGWPRVTYLGGSLLGTGLIFTAGSRSGFAGLGAWMLWFFIGETSRRRWPWYRTLAVALILGIAAATSVSLQPRMAVIIRQWRETGTLNAGDRQRLAMAEFGGLILREHPPLGIGPGSTPLVYPSYRARLSGGVESALQLHSTPMQWAADGGLCSLAAVASIAFALWWRRRHVPHSFAVGTLLAYSAFALTDYQLDLPVFAVAIGVLLALCAITPASSPAALAFSANPQSAIPTPQLPAASSSIPGKPVALALTALVALFLVSQICPWRARASFAEGIDALAGGNRSAFQAGMANAQRLDPSNTYYLNLEACLLADIRAYPAWFTPIDLGADRVDRALAIFEKSLTIDPSQELPHTHLAWLLLAKNPAAAAEHFRAAARLIPDKGSLYFGLGVCQLAQGRNAAAAKSLAMEIVNDPSFVASPEWLSLAAAPGLVSNARRLAAAELERIAGQSTKSDPLHYARRARYTAALLRWLDGDAATLGIAEQLAEPDQRELLRWLAGHPVQPPADSPLPWHSLARAAAQPEGAARIIENHYRYRGLPPELIPPLIRALQTPDRRTLLLPPGTSPLLIQHSYRERAAYPLLMRNLDAPPPRDPYLVSGNRFILDFLQPLFPEKGYLPAPILIDSELVRSSE